MPTDDCDCGDGEFEVVFYESTPGTDCPWVRTLLEGPVAPIDHFMPSTDCDFPMFVRLIPTWDPRPRVINPFVLLPDRDGGSLADPDVDTMLEGEEQAFEDTVLE